jgi:hypothetical protein
MISSVYELSLRREIPLIKELRVLENRLMFIFGPKRQEERIRRRKLYNEELHNLYSSPIITIMTKSRNMRLAGHVARMEETINARILLAEA